MGFVMAICPLQTIDEGLGSRCFCNTGVKMLFSRDQQGVSTVVYRSIESLVMFDLWLDSASKVFFLIEPSEK